MQVHIIGEYGFEEALFGLGLSYGITSHFDSVHAFYTDHLMKRSEMTSDYQRLQKVAAKLAHKDGGHNKFLETITVTLDMRLVTGGRSLTPIVSVLPNRASPLCTRLISGVLSNPILKEGISRIACFH